MKRRSQSGALVALMFSLVITGAGADTVPLNRSLSGIYADAVETQAISREHALSLVESALEFDGESSDALFLRARLLEPDQSRTNEVLADLQAAIASDRFTEMNGEEAVLALARVMLRVRRPEDALETLALLNSDRPGIDPALVAEARYVEVRAALASGLPEHAAETLAEARRQFPNDARFFLVELQDETAPSYRYRRELDRLLRAGAEGAALNAAILRYALTAPTAAERDWARQTYLSLGGDDPSVALTLPPESIDIPAMFAELGGYRRRDVYLSLLGLLSAPAADGAAGESAGALLSEAQGFSGDSLSDRDGDGYWEERVTVESGRIRSWEVDANQDGVSEVSLGFTGAEPHRLTLLQSGEPVDIEYDSYPYVRTVRISGSDGTRTYVVWPFAIQVRVLAELPVGGPMLYSQVMLPESFRGVDLRSVARASSAVEVRSLQGVLSEVQEFESGSVVRARIDSNLDGRLDRFVVYEAGLPAREIRDIDDDGYFEVAVSYDGGEPASSLIDEDDDGRPEVVEHNRGGGEREWDLDRDGTVDVREFGIWTDSVRREFPFLETPR